MSLPLDHIARIEGFGMRSWADGYAFKPTTHQEVREVFELARKTNRQVVLRGAGRSYGDASIAPEQIVLDISAMNRILSWDLASGIIEVEGGVTIEDLWRKCLPDGWWPPVVSGTMFPTIAGALAMNIHGKNAFEAGCLGEHVLSIEVLFPNGQVAALGPPTFLSASSGVAAAGEVPGSADRNVGGPTLADIVSSAGLLGVIVRTRIQMKRVPSGDVKVLPISCANWDEQFAAFEQHAKTSDYMVSWVDSFAHGSKSGRGLFHAANYADGAPATLRPEHQDLPSKILGFFPKSKVWKLLKLFNTRGRMKLLNTLKHASAKLIGNKKEHRQSLVAFSFLLDYVPNWRNAYLPGGFVQYQTFIPKEHAKRVFSEQIDMTRQEKLEPFLAVLKRHQPDQLRFLFGHALDGYSLALDFKVTKENWPRLQQLCHRMNDQTLKAGGRFYFAKDSTLRPEDVTTYLGEEALQRFKAAKAEFDPEGLLTSALAERVGLVQKRA